MKTIKKILAPTDFSARATRALKYAISLAHATEAKLFILHAYRMPSGATGTPYPMTGLYVDVVANQELIEKEVQQSFDEIEDIHLKDKKVQYEFIATCAFPEDAIEEAVEEKEIDLVVMGNRGESKLEKLLGSTTTHIMRRTSCPVLAIPEDAVFAKVDTILLATDFRQVDRANIFEGLLSLANAFHAQVDVLHVSPSEELLGADKLIVGNSLDRTLRAVPHTYHHQKAEDVLEGLQTYLEKHHEVGILAMMPRDHNIWERLTQGSVTKQVVFEADRPVLVFHRSRT